MPDEWFNGQMDKQNREEQSTLGNALHTICWHITTPETDLLQRHSKSKRYLTCQTQPTHRSGNKGQKPDPQATCPLQERQVKLCGTPCVLNSQTEKCWESKQPVQGLGNTSGLGTCSWPLTTTLLPSPGSLLLLLDGTFFKAFLIPLLCALVASWPCHTPSPH